MQASGWIVEGGLAEISSECHRQLMVKACDRKNTTPGLPWLGKSIWERIFFQVREKSGNFVDGQRN